MDKIFTTIISNLEKKGLSVIEIPRFLKDFYRIIEKDHRNEMPVFTINQRLKTLGWQNSMADRHLLELIMYMQEFDGAFPADRIEIPV